MAVLALIGSRRAEAACTWTPDIELNAHPFHASGAFEADFDAPTGSCSFTLHHYLMVLNQDHQPTSTTDGVGYPLASSPGPLWVHRAERYFYATVFACDNGGCTDLFGDEVDETITTGSDQTDGTTEQEEWALIDVASRADSANHYVVSNNRTGASSFFYPGPWARAGKVALYWVQDGRIRFKYTDSAGWQGFNDPAAWSDSIVVAASHATDPDFDSISRPTAFPVTDGLTQFVRLIVEQSQPEDTGIHDDVTVDSTDTNGEDFGLYCASCCADTGGDTGDSGNPHTECDWPSVADYAVCADGSTPCWELGAARHSRPLWDYIGNVRPVDVSDDFRLFFMGKEDNDDCPAMSYTSEDMFAADWDTTNHEWDVEMDTASPSCPVPVILNHHDPGITPLPNDEFKVYAVSSVSPYSVITYYVDSSGGIEADTASPLFVLDDKLTTISHDCIADIDSFARIESGNPYEGMFLHIAEDGDPNYETHGCTDGVDYPGIFFAELQN